MTLLYSLLYTFLYSCCCCLMNLGVIIQSHINVETSNQSIVQFFSHLVLNVLVILLPYSEAVVMKCSVKKLLLNISQNSQENNCGGVPFPTKFQAEQKRDSGTCFTIKLTKSSRKSFLKNISGRLILDMKLFLAIFYTLCGNF